jgi:hypothetical protein
MLLCHSYASFINNIDNEVFACPVTLDDTRLMYAMQYFHKYFPQATQVGCP